MSRTFDVAVVGATGAVGETMISILEERSFPVGELHALASADSAGKQVSFCGRQVRVRDLAEFDFSRVQLALFSAGGAVSREYAPLAASAGCVVVDNSSEFRYDDDVPLVIAEVNPEALGGFAARNIVANPNCSTMQMIVALAPIHKALGIERITVATYQSVSGAGRRGMQELAAQTTALLNLKPVSVDAFPDQIAFNVIPHIDSFQENGYTREEMKLVWETHKILDDPDIAVSPTAVRVPVFYGHSEAVYLETRDAAELETIRALLESAPGVQVIDDPVGQLYPTPVKHATGKDPVFVGRIRRDLSHPRGFNLWIVADNVRKGAALNAVQLAELLVNHHL
ncbi:MAG: aspartate-semialdehyde dehydrogenase [Xanthomonadales bacterium]|nr:aspartate-semialdehyde dehydrogenase [Xanthomonadales bacterium]